MLRLYEVLSSLQRSDQVKGPSWVPDRMFTVVHDFKPRYEYRNRFFKCITSLKNIRIRVDEALVLSIFAPSADD